jgi:branched-chain amino acid transport system permease protein
MTLKATHALYTNYCSYFFLAVIMVVPLVFKDPYFSHILILGGIYIILALGQNIVTGYCGQIHLGMAGFYAIGSYASAILCTQLGASFWLALPLSAAAAAIAGIVVGLPALKVRGGVYLVLVTVSFAGIIQVILNQWVSLTKGPMGIVGIPAPRIAGFEISSLVHWFYLTYFFVVLVTLFSTRLVHSRIGRSFVAVRESETSAQSIGINLAFYKVLAFLISAAFAGLAGAIYAHYMTTISPDVYGFNLSVLVLMMIVVGGISSIPGSILGGVTLAIVPELLRVFGSFQMIVYGLGIILATIFLPSGLLALGVNSIQFFGNKLSKTTSAS